MTFQEFKQKLIDTQDALPDVENARIAEATGCPDVAGTADCFVRDDGRVQVGRCLGVTGGVREDSLAGNGTVRRFLN